MDAKPQRPVRNFKIRDENLPPTFVPSKTIHQRNKSSPSLLTLAKTGGLQLGQKRTAFADVSNTARVVQNFRDDSAIAGKPTCEVVKDATSQENPKLTALLRPAQRPLSVTSIKGFFNNMTSNASSNVPKHNNTEIRRDQHSQSANTGKIVAKKSTAVFKIPEALHREVPTQDVPETGSRASTVPTRKAVGGHEQGNDCRESLQEQKGSAYNNVEIQRPEPLPEPLPRPINSRGLDYYEVRLDGDHPDLNSGGLRRNSERQHLFDGANIYKDAPAQLGEEREPVQLNEKRPLPSISEREIEMPYLLPVSEPEEYWEEEGYDEEYEEGYTTGRSLKSRGDYTTGPTTVLLAPKMTVRVERELAAAKQMVQESRATDDIEEDESWDTSMVAEYGEEIFEYMRVLEERMRPNSYYMDNQTEVQWSMRSVLMDWLVQVHHRFSLLPETLFLCVNYIDRFLSCKIVSLGKLQLVGATAIFVAAKYEEINCPSVQEIVYMVDGGYTVDEILKAERFMLSMLQFELGWPGPMSFLRRVSKADDYDLETRTLAKYFLEITIMDERFVGCVPSFTAAGAHCLARLMLQKGSWTPSHVYYANYTYSQLRPLLLAMLSCCEDPQKHHLAIFEKYGDKRFKRASFFVQSEMSKNFLLPTVPRTSAASSGDGSREWKGR